jgi:ferrochelatase
LEEISQEAQEAYLHAGGETFHYIPCLNDSVTWVNGMHELCLSHMGGWPMQAADQQQLDKSRSEATALGAIN